jgi:hypothetical protein
MNDRTKLPRSAATAMAEVLGPTETVRVVIRGAFDSGLAATDRRILLWKKRRLVEFAWENVADIVFGGGLLVRWVQVRGPSFGLVEPSLLNIGELPDTLQFGELVDDRVQAALKLLARQRGRSRPIDVPHVEASSTARTASGADTPIMEAGGAGGRLHLYHDRVVISHTGFRGLLRAKLPETREILLGSIAEIYWRDPGPFRLGRIGFREEATPPDPSASQTEPENEVMFYLHQERAFREIRAEIERRRTHDPGQRATSTNDDDQESFGS